MVQFGGLSPRLIDLGIIRVGKTLQTSYLLLSRAANTLSMSVLSKCISLSKTSLLNARPMCWHDRMAWSLQGNSDLHAKKEFLALPLSPGPAFFFFFLISVIVISRNWKSSLMPLFLCLQKITHHQAMSMLPQYTSGACLPLFSFPSSHQNKPLSSLPSVYSYELLRTLLLLLWLLPIYLP